MSAGRIAISRAAVASDGGSVYVGGNATELSVIDTASRQVTASVHDLPNLPPCSAGWDATGAA